MSLSSSLPHYVPDELFKQELIYTAEQKSLTKPEKIIPSVGFGFPEIDSFLPHRGLPQGFIHEIFSTLPYPPLTLFTKIAAQADTKKPILWIGEDCYPTPQFLAYHSSQLLDKSIFIYTRSCSDAFWAIDQSLQCKGIWGVFASAQKVTLPILRKFALSARHSKLFFFLYRPLKEKNFTSNAMSRWLLTSSTITIIRYRGLGCEPKEWKIPFYTEESYCRGSHV